MKQRILFLALLFLLCCGCSQEASVPETVSVPPAVTETPAPESSPTPEPAPTPEPEDPLEYVEKLFDGHILKIEITTEESDWSYLMEHAAEKPWISGDVTVDGKTFSNVGIKTKGNSSLSQVAMSGTNRYGLKINFGKFEDDQTCYGLDKLNINNIFGDNTYMKEYMSFHLMEYMEVPCSLYTFAQVTVNGEHYGFCFILEDTDDSFLYRVYGDATVEAYKPESFGMTMEAREETESTEEGGMPGGFPPLPEGFPAFPEGFPEFPEGLPELPLPEELPQRPGGFPGGMGGGRSAAVSLCYIDDDPESYANIFDNSITKIKEKDKKRLIAALKAIDQGEDLETHINVDEVLRYTACNVFLVNLDSYFSNMAHNYILTDRYGQLSMLPWDYNLSFGTHTIRGASAAVNYPIDTVFSGTTAEDRPLVGKLLEVEEYRETYHRYLKEIAEEYVGSGLFAETVAELDALIAPYVEEDTTSFFTYDQYRPGVDALLYFGELRSQSVLGQLDGTIPSTEEEQAESDTLIDASTLDLSAIGSMGMGGGGMGGFPRPGNFPGFPDAP